MGHKTIEGVIGTEVKMRDGLFGLGQPSRNGLARWREWNHLHTRSGVVTTRCVPHIFIGNSTPSPGTGHRTEIYVELVGKLAYRR